MVQYKDVELLKNAVEEQYACTASLRRGKYLSEQLFGGISWEGEVYQFKLEGAKDVREVFAWMSHAAGDKQDKIHMVPKTSEVKTPKHALIVEYIREQQ